MVPFALANSFSIPVLPQPSSDTAVATVQQTLYTRSSRSHCTALITTSLPSTRRRAPTEPTHTRPHTPTHTPHTVFARSRWCWFVAPTRTNALHTQAHTKQACCWSTIKALQHTWPLVRPDFFRHGTSSEGGRGGRERREWGRAKGPAREEQPETHTSESLAELTVRLSVSKTAHHPRPCPCWPHHPTGKPLVLPQPTKRSQHGQAWVHDGQGHWQPNQSERTAEVAMVSVM